MSKANPAKAMAAFLPPGSAVIRPMTLGVYAALERIGSPLVTGEPPKDTLELIPSLYLLTHDPREVFRGNIVDLSMEWAETQGCDVVQRILDAATAQMDAFFAVVPEDGEKKKKPRRAATGGSRRSSTGRPGPTAGATTTSSGASRPPPSPSSGARSSGGKTAPSASSRSQSSRR